MSTTVRYPDNLYVTYNINKINRQLIKESYYWDYDSSALSNSKVLDLSGSNFDNATKLNSNIFGTNLNPLIDLNGYKFDDLSGNIYNLNGNLLDASGSIIDVNSNTFDLSGSFIFDISGSLIKSITNYSLSNNSYRRMLDYKLSQKNPLFHPIAFLTHVSNSGLFEKGINTKNLAIQYYILYDTSSNLYSNVTVGGNVIRPIPTEAELMEFFLLNIVEFTNSKNSLYVLTNANGKSVVNKTTLAYIYVTEPLLTSRYMNFADVANKLKSSAIDPSKKVVDGSFYLSFYQDVAKDLVKPLLAYGTYSDDHLVFDTSTVNTICKAHYINSKHVRNGDYITDENRYANIDDFINSSGGSKEDIIFRAKYKEFRMFKGDFNIKHYLSIYASEISGKINPEFHYVNNVYKLLVNTTGYPNADVQPTEPNRYSNLTEAFAKEQNTWKDYNNFPRRFYYALNRDIRDERINDLINNNNGIIENTDADILGIIIPGHYVINNKNETSNSYRNAVNIMKNIDTEENIFAKYKNGTIHNLTEPFSSSAYFFMNPDLYPWADDTLIDEIVTVYHYVGSVNKTIVVDQGNPNVSKENRPTYNDSPVAFINAMKTIDNTVTDFKSAVVTHTNTRPDLLIKDPTNNYHITLDKYVLTEDVWNTGYATNNINNGALQRVLLQHWNSVK
jgi:hypothetical protein